MLDEFEDEEELVDELEKYDELLEEELLIEDKDSPWLELFSELSSLEDVVSELESRDVSLLNNEETLLSEFRAKKSQEHSASTIDKVIKYSALFFMYLVLLNCR